ncbi:MAG: L-alanine-DL-glutamate epimerase-like enolase superfamily enzyme [Kiritimatiellia bacterium]|jgi:L-alanine-DL-glutamate epimerase-like enolase superfamily enzyme
MPKDSDISIQSAEVSYIPVSTRVPLKFGSETLTSVTVARARITASKTDGTTGVGMGETPLSVQWVWPSALPYSERYEALVAFTNQLATAWSSTAHTGHAMEIGHDFIQQDLKAEWERFNAGREEAMPWLAALVCGSLFDIAVHDAYGKLNGRPVYETYNAHFLNRDLSAFLEPAADRAVNFTGVYPDTFLVYPRPDVMPAWHLVGGLDPLTAAELQGNEPDDGYPVTLEQWIDTDGLTCLKIKLRGNDASWDYDRLVRVGEISLANAVTALTTDFNCTVTDPAYVNDILDQLKAEYPAIHDLILYVEQPFPYDLEENPIDVHSVSARKPLFMDESAHDWEIVRLGRTLGWTGVALKTCKTQTGALLSLCWAKAHGMDLMVQDLTNPMLAQIPHVLLAAHAGTIMGVETNGMQFYPEASHAEARIHPGIYQRRNGRVDLSTIHGPGFGYRLDEIDPTLT